MRGINLGGRHKLPMADLRNEFSKLKFENAVTILNSGNIIFDANENNLADKISQQLERTFGFPAPSVVVPVSSIKSLLKDNPFSGIPATKDTQLYVSFLWQDDNADVKLPWSSPDKSFRIIEKRENTICSVLDLSKTKTPQAMEMLEKLFGKEMTTRNWNTIERIGKKLK